MSKPIEGTVIEGTLKIDDLLAAFFAELARVDKVKASIFGDQHDRLVDQDGELNFAPVVRDSEYGDELFNELLDLLCAVGAEHALYFGSHPGDGADFGWWSTGEILAGAEDDPFLHKPLDELVEDFESLVRLIIQDELDQRLGIRGHDTGPSMWSKIDTAKEELVTKLKARGNS